MCKTCQSYVRRNAHRRTSPGRYKRIRLFGERYGFQPCCIRAFIQMLRNKKLPSRTQTRCGQNMGYIPCGSCCWKIMTGKVTIQGLITNRKCSYPFVKYNQNPRMIHATK